MPMRGRCIVVFYCSSFVPLLVLSSVCVQIQKNSALIGQQPFVNDVSLEGNLYKKS